MKNIIISIDGPAGSGKGEISNYLSSRWALYHLDSGLLYRRISSLIIKNKIDITNLKDLENFVKTQNNLSFRKDKKLKNEEISKISSKIAIFDFVRDHINKLQRKYVSKNIKKTGFVIDGRDIGSVVFKNADLKLYIDVDVNIRAKRRYKQLIDIGEKSIYPQILDEMKIRDKKDMTRKLSPLVIPKDAHIINNNQEFSKTTDQINKLIIKL